MVDNKNIPAMAQPCAVSGVMALTPNIERSEAVFNSNDPALAVGWDLDTLNAALQSVAFPALDQATSGVGRTILGALANYEAMTRSCTTNRRAYLRKARAPKLMP
tara:strand:+ start:132 stop:446 length:315 start_codon:yes stop_codon:yes gene_type:complete